MTYRVGANRDLAAQDLSQLVKGRRYVGLICDRQPHDHTVKRHELSFCQQLLPCNLQCIDQLQSIIICQEECMCLMHGGTELPPKMLLFDEPYQILCVLHADSKIKPAHSAQSSREKQCPHSGCKQGTARSVKDCSAWDEECQVTAMLQHSQMEANNAGTVSDLPLALQQIWHSRQDKHVVTSDDGKGGVRAIISGVVNYAARPCCNSTRESVTITTMSMNSHMGCLLQECNEVLPAA